MKWIWELPLPSRGQNSLWTWVYAHNRATTLSFAYTKDTTKMSPPVQLHCHPVDKVECYFLRPILITPNPQIPNPQKYGKRMQLIVSDILEIRQMIDLTWQSWTGMFDISKWTRKSNSSCSMVWFPLNETVLGIIVRFALIPAESWILYSFIAVFLPASMTVIGNTFLRIASRFELLKDHHYFCIWLATCFPEIQITKESHSSGWPNCILL